MGRDEVLGEITIDPGAIARIDMGCLVQAAEIPRSFRQAAGSGRSWH